VSDEPICTDPAEADQRLAQLADAFLHHDRPIHVACDDSVVRAFGTDTLPIRRSRGYAPLPVRLPVAAPPLLAVGGELKTTACLAWGNRAWLSQHIGDAEHLATHDVLARTVEVLTALTRIAPEVVVADEHPGYLSRRWARDRAAELGAELRTVQHHHAHLASLLAEHGIGPDEPVLGVTFDGTGYGTDATIWGGELLLGSYQRVQRVGHLRPIQLPGGDAAIRRPARSAMAHLHAAGLDWSEDVPSVADADPIERRVLAQMLGHGSGCTPTTSMGRLFDAVASLLAVRQDVDYEGQAAMELEALAATAAPDASNPSAWAWDVTGAATAADPLVLDPTSSVAGAVAAVRQAGARPAVAALAFHEAVADAVLVAARRVRAVHDTRTVGLTGGVFQNALLGRLCVDRLGTDGFVVLTHRTVPPNDGGLALGQAAVVAGGGGG
jgi:hydrogenase maturation protein HypF